MNSLEEGAVFRVMTNDIPGICTKDHIELVSKQSDRDAWEILISPGERTGLFGSFGLHKEEWFEQLHIASKEPWNGTGLPPVGATVECQLSDGHWYKCRIICIDGWAVFAWVGEGPDATYEILADSEFRPIRTEEEKRRANDAESIWAAIDEVEKMMVDAGFSRDEQKPQ